MGSRGVLELLFKHGAHLNELGRYNEWNPLILALR